MKDRVQGLSFFLHQQCEIPGLVKAFLAASPQVFRTCCSGQGGRGDVGGSFAGSSVTALEESDHLLCVPAAECTRDWYPVNPPEE